MFLFFCSLLLHILYLLSYVVCCFLVNFSICGEFNWDISSVQTHMACVNIENEIEFMVATSKLIMVYL